MSRLNHVSATSQVADLVACVCTYAFICHVFSCLKSQVPMVEIKTLTVRAELWSSIPDLQLTHDCGAFIQGTLPTCFSHAYR